MCAFDNLAECALARVSRSGRLTDTGRSSFNSVKNTANSCLLSFWETHNEKRWCGSEGQEAACSNVCTRCILSARCCFRAFTEPALLCRACDTSTMLRRAGSTPGNNTAIGRVGPSTAHGDAGKREGVFKLASNLISIKVVLFEDALYVFGYVLVLQPRINRCHTYAGLHTSIRVVIHWATTEHDSVGIRPHLRTGRRGTLVCQDLP